MFTVWLVRDDDRRALKWTFATATEAIAQYTLVVIESAIAVATDAFCTLPGCPHPALVPDGLCREHAEEQAHTELIQFVRGLDQTERGGTEKQRHRALARILRLGLIPADLEPTQEPPR